MIRFYTSREIAKRLGINLARWKRWSREFLPPDPLGGLQSGYARQYNPNEAFTVFMAGYLVATLKFSIPEARTIMHDLNDWLLSGGYYFKFSEDSQAPKTLKAPGLAGTECWIWIAPRNHDGIAFQYRIETVLDEKPACLDDHPAVEQQSIRWSLDLKEAVGISDAFTGSRIINITRLRSEFLNRLAMDANTA
jgi:hypothetical protein